MRTIPGDETVRQGRLSKALQFQRIAYEALELADDPREVADAVVTLCVHAGIAASDTLCIAALGEYSKGQDHQEAVGLLNTVDKKMGSHLNSLLNMKTRAGYGYSPVNADQLKKAQRAMEALIEAARS